MPWDNTTSDGRSGIFYYAGETPINDDLESLYNISPSPVDYIYIESGSRTVTGKVAVSGTIELIWSHLPEEYDTHYEVSLLEGGGASLVNETPKLIVDIDGGTGAFWGADFGAVRYGGNVSLKIDGLKPNTEYSVAIRVVNRFNNRSEWKFTAVPTTTGGEIAPTVAIDSVVASYKGLEIDWSYPTNSAYVDRVTVTASPSEESAVKQITNYAGTKVLIPFDPGTVIDSVDVSVYNAEGTVTDTANLGTGWTIPQLASADLGDNAVRSTHLDWGTGAGQVNVDEVPDGTTYKRTTTAEKTGAGYASTNLDANGVAEGAQLGSTFKLDVSGNIALVSDDSVVLNSSGSLRKNVLDSVGSSILLDVTNKQLLGKSEEVLFDLNPVAGKASLESDLRFGNAGRIFLEPGPLNFSGVVGTEIIGRGIRAYESDNKYAKLEVFSGVATLEIVGGTLRGSSLEWVDTDGDPLFTRTANQITGSEWELLDTMPNSKFGDIRKRAQVKYSSGTNFYSDDEYFFYAGNLLGLSARTFRYGEIIIHDELEGGNAQLRLEGDFYHKNYLTTIFLVDSQAGADTFGEITIRVRKFNTGTSSAIDSTNRALVNWWVSTSSYGDPTTLPGTQTISIIDGNNVSPASPTQTGINQAVTDSSGNLTIRFTNTNVAPASSQYFFAEVQGIVKQTTIDLYTTPA